MSRQNRAASVEPDPLFFATVFVGLLAVGTGPRLLRLFIKPDTVYPLHGFRYTDRAIAGLSKREVFPLLPLSIPDANCCRYEIID